MDYALVSIFAGLIGLAIGLVIMKVLGRMGLDKAQIEAKSILEDSNSKAENIIRQANLDGKQNVYELKLQAEKEIKEQKKVLQQTEARLARREDSLGSREENLNAKERKLDERAKVQEDKILNLSKMEQELQAMIASEVEVLERVANLDQEAAKAELMDIVAKKTEKEVAEYLHEMDEQAREKAAQNAREILATAIQRYANEETLDRTVSVVTLPNEDMKGRIIGREGRNIRAIEQITGVDLIIDDTPDVITVSCFDPIRREIARQSLEILMKDGRIQPGRIEDVVNKVRNELEDTIYEIGNETVYELGIGRINRELIRLVGRLRFRYSYGQNVLEHSKEVAYFAGIMAAELGLNQQVAKRAGLLHDIGKAVDFEMDGTHVELGAKFAKKYGENGIVVNAIEAHHGDVPPQSLIANLVAAADTLSAARPGARYESMENYIERLENLEKIATSYEGVSKAYAIQAGREIRVMVEPNKIDDVTMTKVAHDIRERIENELTYPGQIKVTLIREVRVQELAQ